MGLHVGLHPLIDAFCCPPQGQLAQRRQVAQAEKALDRPLRLVGDIDLALTQPLQQLLRRQIHQFDFGGVIQEAVRNGLADANASNLRDGVVQALQMLDVDCGIDVDASRQEFLHIEVTFGVAPKKIFSRPRPSCCAAASNASGDGRWSRSFVPFGILTYIF
jgi:hypothetical protein